MRTGLYGKSGDTPALNTLESIESGQRTMKGLNLLVAVRCEQDFMVSLGTLQGLNTLETIESARQRTRKGLNLLAAVR